MPEWNLLEPQRQSLLGVVVYIIRNFRFLLALFLTFITLGMANPQYFVYVVMVLIPLALLLSVLAWYQYRNFTFHVDGDELVIHKGVFIKERVVIPVDRIQSIQIADNIVQRILGVVSLKVDTAGSKGNELSIPALEQERAEQLKDLLYKKRDAVLGGPQATEEAEGEVRAETATDQGKVLLHLSLFDLLKVGLTENHLRTGAIALAVVFGYMSQYQEYIEEYVRSYVDEYAEQVTNAGFAFVISFLLLYILLSVLLSVGRTLLRFYDLKAVLRAEAVEISTGLLQRQRHRIPIRKIQFVQWETNPLRKLAGYESAVLKPSNPVGETPRQQVNEIPALKLRDSQYLAAAVFEGYTPPPLGLKANTMAYLRIRLILWSLLILPAIFGMHQLIGSKAFGILLLYPFIAFFGWKYGLSVWLNFDNQYLMVLKGWVFPKRLVMPLHKVQSVSIAENVFLRRRKLCHLVLYTAAGTRMVRYMHLAEAYAMASYLLYKVERYNEPWM